MTVRMIFALGFFKTFSALYRRLGLLRFHKRILITGTVSNGKDTGCPPVVYATQQFQEGTLESHELPLTEILLRWRVFPKRGNAVNRVIRPDATICNKLHVEYDTGSMDLERVEAQTLSKYRTVDDPVVFITNRPKVILQRGSFLQGRLMACTQAEALNAPRIVLLRHCDGDTIFLSDLLEMVRRQRMETELAEGF